MQTEDRSMKQVNDQPSGNLPFLKPDDIQYFDKLLVSTECTFLDSILYTQFKTHNWMFVLSEVQ